MLYEINILNGAMALLDADGKPFMIVPVSPSVVLKTGVPLGRDSWVVAVMFRSPGKWESFNNHTRTMAGRNIKRIDYEFGNFPVTRYRPNFP